MIKPRRDIAVFSLSFLDCISCGFGAIILLFVISLGSERLVIKDIRDTLFKLYQERMTELDAIKGKTIHLTQDLKTKKDAMELEKDTVASMKVEIEILERKIKEAIYGKENLLVELDQVKEFVDAQQAIVELEHIESDLPIGVPVESNHLIFILDTSGSMRDPRSGRIWNIVISKIQETLEIYPIVNSIQVMDADGNYVLRPSAGQWIPDSPTVRSAIGRALSFYGFHSQSNPVPGITKAIKVFLDPNDPEKKIGIFVFGDEFTDTAERVLTRIDKLNPADEEGNRLITINAIGFPHIVKFERHYTKTGLKFANLMRELTYQHGGAFVGIQN